jgi:uncharacterized protein
MDRPEWGAVDPNTGEVYFTLTNNDRRIQADVDMANPRAGNQFGHIIRWRRTRGPHRDAVRVGPLRDRGRRLDQRRSSRATRSTRPTSSPAPTVSGSTPTAGCGSRPTSARAQQNKGDFEQFGNNAMLARTR